MPNCPLHQDRRRNFPGRAEQALLEERAIQDPNAHPSPLVHRIVAENTVIVGGCNSKASTQTKEDDETARDVSLLEINWQLPLPERPLAFGSR